MSAPASVVSGDLAPLNPSPSVTKGAAVPARRSLLESWHLLSLDAPTVVAVWTLLVNADLRRSARWMDMAALALATWMIYALDRLLDARARREALHERHRFHWRHRRLFLVGLPAAALLLAALLCGVDASTRDAWLLLSCALLPYAAMVHWLRVPGLPKPVVTGVFFALAITLPAWIASGGSRREMAVGGVVLACLCWFNCEVIDHAERAPVASPHGLCLRMAGADRVVAGGAVLLGLGVALPWWRDPVCAACALSFVLLCGVARVAPRIGPARLRPLADVALLTPLLVLPFAR